MSLYNELKKISKKQWCYYDNITFSGYEEAIENPIEFILSYFHYAGKNEFLYGTLFDSMQNNEEQTKRAVHTVNTFFLGLYFKEKIDYLNPNKNSYLANDNNFVWAWFLCSLYHDAFFNIDEEITLNFDYAHFSNRLLYSRDLIKRYYEKGKNPETSHNGKINHDHGIVAAERLFTNYMKMIIEKSKQEQNTFQKFLANRDLDYCGLKINFSTFTAMCKVAKIIASHNIYVSTENNDGKYDKLPELLTYNSQFRYMPNIKTHRQMSSYERLYFLLALVDTLEPSKRTIDLNDIDIQLDKLEFGKYSLHINVSKPQENYFNGIKNLNNWLNFVEVSDNSLEIYLDFNKNKNI